MADSSLPELPSKSVPPGEPAPRKRVHSYGRLTTALAVLALAVASYALWRLDATRARLDQVNDFARSLEADRNALQGELRALAQREAQREREISAQLATLDHVPKQVQELSSSVADLHGRTEGPQRAWSRAEALFLMEIAQRSLVLDRDVATAIAALESADSRLASVRDPALTAVRQQLALELQALRAVRVVDRTGVLTRLSALETQAMRLPVAGILAREPDAATDAALPEGFFSRAGAIISRSLANLIRVREVDRRGGAVVTTDEQLLRKQHLQLLLFSARTAVVRNDQTTYRGTLAAARQWLSESFDMTAPATQGVLKEIQLLETIAIDPPLPSISKSAERLQQLMPQGDA